MEETYTVARTYSSLPSSLQTQMGLLRVQRLLLIHLLLPSRITRRLRPLSFENAPLASLRSAVKLYCTYAHRARSRKGRRWDAGLPGHASSTVALVSLLASANADVDINIVAPVRYPGSPYSPLQASFCADAALPTGVCFAACGPQRTCSSPTQARATSDAVRDAY